MPSFDDRLRACLAAFVLIGAGAAPARADDTRVASLADLTLEELSDVTVTSVSGRPQTLRSAASSIYVITAEEIRRSAATTLPEALRLAPNLQVAQQSAGQWAISARGFNNTLSNKLLVLIDGRAVYSPLFAGVFWDLHDVVLEDVERIEVISGPGGTIWGANAVNGVINVVTRPAQATQGALVSVTRGSGSGVQTGRIGLRAGPHGFLRLYAMAGQRPATRNPATGASLGDDARKLQAGFRGDWELAGRRVSLQGDWYEGGDLPSTSLSPRIRGGNINGRIEGLLPDGSPFRVQLVHDVTWREETGSYRYAVRTTDLQFLSEQPRRGAHQWTWGAGLRASRDDFESAGFVSFDPRGRSLRWANVFAQDQLRVGDRGELTLGVKLEDNSYTGAEWMPSVRYAHAHAGGDTTWAAVSRAVRAPARLDREFFVPRSPPYMIAGGSRFESEVADVFELGHRGSLGPHATYDVTLFRQHERKLRVGSNTVPITVENRIGGNTDGIEAWARWNVTRSWRMSAGYLRLHERYAYPGVAPAVAAAGMADLGNDPSYQVMLTSRWDIGSRNAVDLVARRVGALPAPAVPAYTAVDARLAWFPRPDLEVSLLGQNILDAGHVEFATATVASELRRRVLLRLVWQP